MGFLTTGQEAQVNAAMNSLHYNFAERNPFYARDISGATVVSSNPNHNSFYGGSPQNTTVTNVETSGLFYARTKFVTETNDLENLDFNGNNQKLPALVGNTVLKVITDVTGKSLLENSKDIFWDGDWYENASTPRKHGLLQKNFYTFYLEGIK